jgi:hypothetical protein
METNKIKTASRSESKRSTNRKSATSTALTGATPKRAATPAAGTRKRTKTVTKGSTARPTAALSPQQRAKRIAEAAYFLAEQRAFAPHHELDDWLAAERSL